VFLRNCVILAAQQAAVFAVSFLLVAGMRFLTGVDARSGRVPIDALSFVAIAGLFTAIVLCSRWFFRLTDDRASRDTVLWPTWRRAGEFAVGTVIAFLLAGCSTLAAFASGSMRIAETVADKFSPAMLVYVVTVGMLLLVYNSVMEEYASRAFPLALFRRSPILVRIVVPALFFAAAHLAAEPFRLAAFYIRFVNGAVFAVAFLLTGNVWLASGVHTGVNLAVLAGSGRWYLGGLARFEGTPVGPDWLDPVLWTTVLVAGVAWLYARNFAAWRHEASAGGSVAARSESTRPDTALAADLRA
jgi:membrane protease YdiL (CAAX protease family)